MELKLFEKKKEKKEESEDFFDSLDNNNSTDSLLNEDRKETKNESKKVNFKRFFTKKNKDEILDKPRRKIFNFEWWEYIIIIVEIILSIYIILLFIGGFSL